MGRPMKMALLMPAVSMRQPKVSRERPRGRRRSPKKTAAPAKTTQAMLAGSSISAEMGMVRAALKHTAGAESWMTTPATQRSAPWGRRPRRRSTTPRVRQHTATKKLSIEPYRPSATISPRR
jgi:hypothetical protein